MAAMAQAQGEQQPALFFTPSFRNDLDRLILLRRSIRKYYQGHARHVIAVPKEDFKLFKSALNDNACTLIVQNSLVRPEFFPHSLYGFIKKNLPGQAWRFNRLSGKGGWIIQQIAKLSSFELLPAGPVVVLDSDLLFLRPFADKDLLSDKGRILIRITPDTESGKHRKHIANARRFLGLPEGSTEHHYMSCPAILHAEWLREMTNFIEARFNKPWQEALYEEETMSEYSIYGVFVEEILKPDDLVIRDISFNHMIWDRSSYDDFFLDPDFMANHAQEKLCAVVQSALKIPTEEYQASIASFLDKN